jgi:diaminohydroxyphosphoribosylaminopyrimidine deaminase/5-amino-6-(5-phosphoribosylamino)uracil reductase
MASFGPLNRLSEGVGLNIEAVDRLGADLRVRARVSGHDTFLHTD